MKPPTKKQTKRPKVEEFATLSQWHAWLRNAWPPDEHVMEVLMSDFEKETKLKCPERLR